MVRREFDWKLPKRIADRLGDEGYGSQRTIYEQKNLLIILHKPNDNLDDSRSHIIFLRSPNGKLFCNGKTKGTIQLQGLMSEYKKIHQLLDDELENAKDAKDYILLLEKVIPLSRQVNNMTLTMQEARRHVNLDHFFITMRDISIEIKTSFDTLLTDSQLALQFHRAQKAEELLVMEKKNLTASTRLNTLAALTFPLVSIASLADIFVVMDAKWSLVLSTFSAFMILGIVVITWVRRNR